MEIILAGWLVSLAQSHPWILSAVAVVGVLRVINKPLFSFLHTVVDATPSPKDNEVLGKAESSSIYKAVCYVLDLLGSIKLPQK